jgi:hypothetical protein|tara:strand:+ start:231 stop:488 length:258 start_codon:yes stop_codon:yes gene_type:complete
MLEEISVAQLIADFGFPVVMVVGLGYFVYYVWQTINNVIDPAVAQMKTTIIRLTDQLRLLDQDMIRLKEKVDTVVKLKENDENKD